MGGGKGSSQTVGYKYSFSEHLLLCKNMISLMSVRFEDRVAWEGYAPGGSRIFIDRKNLFGGDSREGGVLGYVDVLNGDPAQGRNDILSAGISSTVSAYRYVSSLVFRDFYHGNHPYPKPPRLKVSDDDVYKRWEPAIARIPRGFAVNSSRVYIAMDGSGSMVGSRYAAQTAAAKKFVESFRGSSGNSLRLVLFGDEAQLGAGGLWASIERTSCTDADYDEILTWLDNLPDITVPATAGTNYENAVATAPAFFTAEPIVGEANYVASDFGDIGEQIAIADNSSAIATTTSATYRRYMIFMSDGEPTGGSLPAALATLDSIDQLSVFCFSLGLSSPVALTSMDNTPTDGVPVVNATNVNEIAAALNASFATWVDMNPAHMLRYFITGTDTHDEINTDLVGASMLVSAKTLFDENFGLSFFVRSGQTVADVKGEIERHIDGSFYFDPATGQYELNLVRDDYDPNTLFTFDPSNVSVWGTDINRELEEHLPNRVVVTYKSQIDNADRAVTVVNSARSAALAGQYITSKKSYPGVRDTALALQIADRDLQAEGVRKWSGTITVPYCPVSLNKGRVFRLQNPKFGLDIVARVAKKTSFDGKTHATRITFVEDVFSLSGTVLTTVAAATSEDEVVAQPQVATARLVQETPYYLAYLSRGAAELGESLTADPTLGYLHIAAAAPNLSHLTYNVARDDGGGYALQGTTNFTPAKTIASALTRDPMDNVVVVNDLLGLDSVKLNTLATINGEFVRVDSVVAVGATFEITVGRGCLDTVPIDHQAGSVLLFSRDQYFNDGKEYSSGEVFDYKLLPSTGSLVLGLNAAPVDNLTFAARPIRPYPPGDVLLDGTRVSRLVVGGEILTWKARNRLTQTSEVPEDFLATDVAAEVGTTYTVRIEAFYGDTSLGVYHEASSGGVQSYVVTDWVTGRPATATAMKIYVVAIRDGYESWTAYPITLNLADLMYFEDLSDNEPHVTSEQDLRATED